MSIKTERWIRRMAREHGMIEPLKEARVSQEVSFGASSYGYYMRVSKDFRIFTNVQSSLPARTLRRGRGSPKRSSSRRMTMTSARRPTPTERGKTRHSAG